MINYLRDNVWHNTLRQRVALFTGAILLFIAVALTVQLTAEAHFNNRKWISSTPLIRDNTTDFGTHIVSAIADYNSHTDATIYTCASSNCQQNWTHEQNNYGDTNDYAYTESYAYIKNPPPMTYT